MRRTACVLITAAVALAVATPAAAQRERPVIVDIPVSPTVSGTEATGIYDEGSGQFLTRASELVSAVLRNEVNFFLDLGSSKALSPRNVCVDLSRPVVAAVSAPGRVCADMHWNTSDSGSMTAMVQGATQLKRMQLTWSDDQGTYYLRWGASGTAVQNWVTVHCTAGGPGGCTSWAISNADAVATLSLNTRRAVTQLGDFYVPVSISVTAQW